MYHQYASGSFPSMSRTWVRAHAGHNQLRPFSSWVIAHASASVGGASARDRPHRTQCAAAGSGSSTMARKLTSVRLLSKVDSRGAEDENVVPRTGVCLVRRIDQAGHRLPVDVRELVLANTGHPD